MEASLASPLILGRYALYDEIASGGMASVHLVLCDGSHSSRAFVGLPAPNGEWHVALVSNANALDATSAVGTDSGNQGSVMKLTPK